MTNLEQVQAWKEHVYPVLISKAEEFQLLGYESVTPENIWDCMLAKLKRRKKEEYMLHQLVNEIFKLSANEYMNWLSIQAVASTDFALLEKESRSLLGID